MPYRLTSPPETLTAEHLKRRPLGNLRPIQSTLKSISGLAALVATISLMGGSVRAQCPVVELTSGLRIPLGITQSHQRNLLVAEAGTRAPNTGRISIVDPEGHRRTLLDGLPSGINDVNEPSGPAGLFIRGRTLYVAIGVGDVGIRGPFVGTALPNPNSPSSPIFSSILAIHFSARVEQNTEGLTLTLADHQALANGEKVTLSNGAGDRAAVELIADFPDFTPNPLPSVPANVRLSNPFDLVVVDDQAYVTDGGGNVVRQVDIPTGAFSTLAVFPPIPNPFFNPAPPPPSIGGPLIEAVPTGICYSDGQLLVTLFSGAPFAPGTSQVQAVDPMTGAQTPFIAGLKTAIDVLPVRDGASTHYLVLEHASTGLFFGSPGLLLDYAAPSASPAVIANCLVRPTSMALDEHTGILYVTEAGGRLVAIPVAP